MSGADFATMLMEFFAKITKFFNSIMRKLGIIVWEDETV